MPDLSAKRATRLRPPSWLDGRLMLGVVLALVSIVIGVKLLAAADHYDHVWVFTRDVAAGTVVTTADVAVAGVRFHDHAGAYLDADTGSPAGMVVNQPMFAGEMVPRSALVAVKALDPYRLVTVPVSQMHMPREARGGVAVDVYSTAKNSAPKLVLASAVIDQTFTSGSGFGSTGSEAVVLRVPADHVADVVAATRDGDIDLVQVPTAQAGAPAVPLPTAAASPSGTPARGSPARQSSADGAAGGAK